MISAAVVSMATVVSMAGAFHSPGIKLIKKAIVRLLATDGTPIPT